MSLHCVSVDWNLQVIEKNNYIEKVKHLIQLPQTILMKFSNLQTDMLIELSPSSFSNFKQSDITEQIKLSVIKGINWNWKKIYFNISTQASNNSFPR